MRVLHVVESLEPEAGSVAVSLRGLFIALQKCGLESEVVTLDSEVPAPGLIRNSGLKAALGNRFVHGAAVVHVHGWGTEVARRMAAAACQARKPYVVSPLGALGRGPFRKRRWRDKLRGLLVDNKLLRRATTITTLNIWEQHVLQGRGLDRNVHVLPYGLTVGDYIAGDNTQEVRDRAPGVRYLLFLGPIHPIEGLVPLMRAVGEMGADADGWNIVLAGPERGAWRKMIEATVRRKGGAERVVFTAAPDVESQRAWLARASVLAAPSLYPRCPVSVIQAMAAGVPVIASDCVAPDGLDGAIRSCPPKREPLKAALNNLFKVSDDERAALAQQARGVARSMLDWSVLADRYAQLYRNLA